jgi:glycosyltransferase involved in cell wall biosynthesis
MTDFVSVILPTYNPDIARLNQTIAGLQNQSLPVGQWELLIIDNNSNPAVAINLDWHPNHKIIKEPKPGLTNARLKGFGEAAGNLIVLVDDDNVLDKEYLKNTISILTSNEKLGAIGGKSIPAFEVSPPDWLSEFYGNLALRDLGNDVIISDCQNDYPAAAPIGAGMAIRHEALATYINKITTGQNNISDRIGKSLSSGGDNDLILEILKSGWQVGYFPQLQLQHIIPAQRMEVTYLSRLVHDTNKSWVQLLESHGINPWKKISISGVLPRKIKAWFTYNAWKSNINYIKWQGACGFFEGLANLPRN